MMLCKGSSSDNLQKTSTPGSSFQTERDVQVAKLKEATLQGLSLKKSTLSSIIAKIISAATIGSILT